MDLKLLSNIPILLRFRALVFGSFCPLLCFTFRHFSHVLFSSSPILLIHFFLILLHQLAFNFMLKVKSFDTISFLDHVIKLYSRFKIRIFFFMRLVFLTSIKLSLLPTTPLSIMLFVNGTKVMQLYDYHFFQVFLCYECYLFYCNPSLSSTMITLMPNSHKIFMKGKRCCST